MNSLNNVTPNFQTQRRYLLEWFNEFSDMQKNDFLPILVLKFGNKAYVNGLLPGMEAFGNLEDRPPSIFQCRMKLFMEWAENWNQEEKENLLVKLKELDPTFSSKYEKEVAGEQDGTEIGAPL